MKPVVSFGEDQGMAGAGIVQQSNIFGPKEYDVYVLIEHEDHVIWPFSLLRPKRRSYQIVLGGSRNSAGEAAKQAEVRTNAAGGRAIGIAADAITCCIEQFKSGAEDGGEEGGGGQPEG